MKRKVLSEKELTNMTLPGEGQLLGIVYKMLGYDRVMVKCEDGKDRLCRISGKLKRRVWVRDGDVVLISPWDFQAEKGDIKWRYTRNQNDWLRRNGYLKRL